MSESQAPSTVELQAGPRPRNEFSWTEADIDTAGLSNYAADMATQLTATYGDSYNPTEDQKLPSLSRVDGSDATEKKVLIITGGEGTVSRAATVEGGRKGVIVKETVMHIKAKPGLELSFETVPGAEKQNWIAIDNEDTSNPITGIWVTPESNRPTEETGENPKSNRAGRFIAKSLKAARRGF